MGYTTEFDGVLRFASEVTATQLAYLKTIFGQDYRDHPEWGTRGPEDPYYIDLELADDFSGIKWSGAEKSYYMEKQVNLVLRLMRAKWPEFGLTGQLSAQGEDFQDRWYLVIENGEAVKRPIVITGTIVECPHCGAQFVLEEQDNK